MHKIIGYILVSLPFLAVCFVGWIIPDAPNWVGFASVGIAGALVGIIWLGVWLTNM